MGNYDSLLTVVKKRKCRRFGHIANGTLANTILHGKLEGERKRGRPARQWLGDIKADQQGSGLVTSRQTSKAAA